MVHLKASSLVLVAAIAGYAQNAVLARRSNVREYREDALSTRELQDEFIRAVVGDALLGRSVDLKSSELFTRDSGDLERRSPQPVTNFFKGIGQFVKRVFHEYWREMQDDVKFLDLRRLHPHPEDNFKSRRHRMEGNEMEARNEAEGFRSRRRRFDNGHLVRRHQDDLRDRRRRFSDGRIVERHHQDTYRDRRRRFSNGRIERGYTSGQDDVLAARQDQDQLEKRMGWYGKALLIYRDMKHPASELVSRETAGLESRELQRLLWLRRKATRSLDDLD